MDVTPPTASLALDVMGADLGVDEVLRGVALALSAEPIRDRIVLVGDEAQMRDAASHQGLADHPALDYVHATQVIAMDDKPVAALKNKKDSSMVRAIELVRDGRVRAIMSCGNTGALMAGGTLKLRTFPGIERCALTTIMPKQKGFFALVDAGANPESKPEHLLHNAILGANFARVVFGLPKPRVGLLTIGTEEGKGTERIQATHQLLKSIHGALIDYRGLIEGFQVYGDAVEVVVTDGFTGNIMLKSSQSLARLLKDSLSEAMKRSPWRMLGAAICRGGFREVGRRFNPETYGAAPFLGLNGYVLKAHGSSNHRAIAGGIAMALQLVRVDLLGQLIKEVEQANQMLKPQPIIG